MSCGSKAKSAERSLRTENEINFQPYAVEGDGISWPDRHRSKFLDISKTLGHASFKRWVAEQNGNSSHSNRDLRHRVDKVSARARRLLRIDANESDWRQNLEPLVFKSCVCQGRLWLPNRATAWSSGPVRTRLCECAIDHPVGGTPGIDEVFDVRSEYRVPVNNGKNEKPDKIVGLRRVGSLSRTIFAKDSRDQVSGSTLWETLRPSLAIDEREPVMFPFLVAESKAANAPGSFNNNYDQMSTIIKKSLEIQIRLYDALKPCDVWEDGPVVWVMANRGPVWEISAAYPRRIQGEVCSKKRHPCPVLWRGDVRFPDKALQLLLIMDYIYEWARGYHRSSLINGLESLAEDPIRDDVSDVPSVAKHTVFSRNDYEDDEDYRPPIRPGIPVDEDSNNEEIAIMPVADSAYAVLRDASRVRSRFLGIIVTQDSLKRLHLNDGSALLGQLSTILHNVAHGLEGQFLYLKRCQINEIEADWTEYRRLPHEKERHQETFLVLLTLTAFISADWHPTRELSIIAISTTVLRDRLDKGLQARLRLDEKLDPKLTPIMNLTEAFKEAPSHATLAASMNGISLTPSRRMWELLERSFFTEEITSIDRTDIHPGGVLEISKSPWRNFASRLLQTRQAVEPLADFVLESSRDRTAKEYHFLGSNAHPWIEHRIIASQDKTVLAYSPPANPLQEEMAAAEAAMYCLYCLQMSSIDEILGDLRSDQTAVEECWKTDRMTKDCQKKLLWNKLELDQWPEDLMLQVARNYINYLVN